MDIRKFYDKAVYYSVNSGRKERILQLIPDGVKNILDIGCGPGVLAKELKSRGYLVTGTDVSEKALTLAREHLFSGYSFNIEEENWPVDLMNQNFDLIIAAEIIEHLFEAKEFLKKIRSLLSEDSHVIITTPNFVFWRNRLKILAGKFKYEEKGILDFGHVRFFTLATVNELFDQAGLEVEEENHFFPNLYRRRYLSFLGKLWPGLFAYQLIFRLRPKKRE